jgi:hypothetical protein
MKACSMNTKYFYSLSLFLVLIIPLLFNCSHVIPLKSIWTEKSLTAELSDWDGATYTIEDKKVAIGIKNDKDNLYVSFQPLSPGLLMQMMEMGFTVWFDSTGGRDKICGIRYPIGHEGFGASPVFLPDKPKKGKHNPKDNFEKNIPKEIEILGPGKYDRQRKELDELKNIHVELKFQDRAATYVLQVPFHDNGLFSWSIHSAPGKTIGIGFETEKPKMDRPKNFDMSFGGGDMGGGGMGGGHQGGPKGGPGGPPGGMSLSKLELWTQVTLAIK